MLAVSLMPNSVSNYTEHFKISVSSTLDPLFAIPSPLFNYSKNIEGRNLWIDARYLPLR